MQPSDSTDNLINAAAVVVIPAVALVMLARATHGLLPLRLPYGALGLTILFIVLASATAGLVHTYPTASVLAWFVVGLMAYLVRWRIRTAEARAKNADRLRQARGHERRRAVPPPTTQPPGRGP